MLDYRRLKCCLCCCGCVFTRFSLSNLAIYAAMCWLLSPFFSRFIIARFLDQHQHFTWISHYAKYAILCTQSKCTDRRINTFTIEIALCERFETPNTSHQFRLKLWPRFFSFSPFTFSIASFLHVFSNTFGHFHYIIKRINLSDCILEIHTFFAQLKCTLAASFHTKRK